MYWVILSIILFTYVTGRISLSKDDNIFLFFGVYIYLVMFALFNTSQFSKYLLLLNKRGSCEWSFSLFRQSAITPLFSTILISACNTIFSDYSFLTQYIMLSNQFFCQNICTFTTKNLQYVIYGECARNRILFIWHRLYIS